MFEKLGGWDRVPVLRREPGFRDRGRREFLSSGYFGVFFPNRREKYAKPDGKNALSPPVPKALSFFLVRVLELHGYFWKRLSRVRHRLRERGF